MLSHLFGQPRRAMLTVMAYILLLMCGIGWTIFSFIQEREEVMVHNSASSSSGACWIRRTRSPRTSSTGCWACI